eukprot:TRINITY_DN8517_c1_g1_i4.p1 TRINITY_DN8517_c1_g1~~TRINITY_DN8517_c1_g1_i4.p1  ORF type:complete len:166 (-),score=41.44 TRINITY_DN8517_c1_g1_i4:70-567(-)
MSQRLTLKCQPIKLAQQTWHTAKRQDAEKAIQTSPPGHVRSPGAAIQLGPPPPLPSAQALVELFAPPPQLVPPPTFLPEPELLPPPPLPAPAPVPAPHMASMFFHMTLPPPPPQMPDADQTEPYVEYQEEDDDHPLASLMADMALAQDTEADMDPDNILTMLVRM